MAQVFESQNEAYVRCFGNSSCLENSIVYLLIIYSDFLLLDERPRALTFIIYLKYWRHFPYSIYIVLSTFTLRPKDDLSCHPMSEEMYGLPVEFLFSVKSCIFQLKPLSRIKRSYVR